MTAEEDSIFRLLEAQRDKLYEALSDLLPTRRMPDKESPCHAGLIPQEHCAYCNRIKKGLEALAYARGDKL